MKFRTKSGELSTFVLDSIRGLSEILQYGQGNTRLNKMNQLTDELSEEGRMKRVSGRNMAVTNTIILIFDLTMFLSPQMFFQNGEIGFVGVLIPTIALMSSLGPMER